MNQSDLTGPIEPGKKADFIVLDQDVVKLANTGKSSQIEKNRVLQTWFTGHLVYGEKSL